MRQRRRSERETFVAPRGGGGSVPAVALPQKQQKQSVVADPPPARNGFGDGNISVPISNPMPTNVGKFWTRAARWTVLCRVGLDIKGKGG